jgi:hypothetical protein
MRQATIRVAATSIDEEDERLGNPVVKQMRVAAEADDNYRDLVLAVEDGIMTERTKLYKNILPDLTTEDGLVLYRQRLVVPKACRKDVSARLHASHLFVHRTYIPHCSSTCAQARRPGSPSCLSTPLSHPASCHTA